MYGIEFYETEDGKCPIWDFLEALRLKAPTNKDARIQHKQASLYIELLQQNGTHMNAEITKHLDDGIWELRPGNNRVFYFFYQNDTYSAWKTGCAAEVHSHRTFRTPVLFYVLSVWINLEPSPDCHFSRCQSMPADVKSWTTFFTNKFEKKQKNKPYKAFSRYRTALSLVGLNCYSI